MKITDLLVESNQQTTEAPMGFLKSMGNKVAGAFGSGQAQGRLETGKEANQLKKDFDVFLGKTGQQPTGDMIVKFLKQKGYPTSSAERLLGGELTSNVRTAATQTSQVQQPAAPQQPSQPNQADIAKRVKANVGKSAAASKASNFGQQPEKPAQPAPNVIGNFVKQQTGDNPITMKPAPQKAPQQPVAQPVRAQGGGKVAGQVSQTANAIKKRQARAVKRRTGHPADDNPNIQLGTESLVHEGSTLFKQALNLHRILKEALSAKQIDAVFLAAVQDKQKLGTQQPAATSQPTDTTSLQPNTGSTLLKHAAAAYDGMRGAAYGATKVGQEAPGKELKDTSGRVPANIMSQINSLTNKQRAQLRKELDKA